MQVDTPKWSTRRHRPWRKFAVLGEKWGFSLDQMVRTYQTWASMRDRCNNKGSNSYHKYGARGISICKRWDSFENFLIDMGPRPDDKSLDRFPNFDGNYEPGNCRWATNGQQNGNKRTSILIDYQGERVHLSKLARLVGVDTETFRKRVHRHGAEKALRMGLTKTAARAIAARYETALLILSDVTKFKDMEAMAEFARAAHAAGARK